MRCKACDRELKEHELDNRGMFTSELTGLCNKCQSMSEDDSHDTDQGHFEGPELETSGATRSSIPDREIEYDDVDDWSNWPYHTVSALRH